MLLPLTTAINQNGRISIGGSDVAELKSKYNTPLYIIDTGQESHSTSRIISALETTIKHLRGSMRENTSQNTGS